MPDTDEVKIACFWGYFRMDYFGNVKWYPSNNIAMTPDEQYRQNVINGYIKPRETRRDLIARFEWV